ncbi:MAG: CopG family ribbon-helix-helix protein [Pseudobdellovibrionaceae bacterium]
MANLDTQTPRNTPLSVKLEPTEKSALAKIAEGKKRSVHFVMREALSEYIDREQKRLDFYEDGRKALEHYKATGLHVTSAEIQTWAESLGTSNELPQPVCHE